MDLQILCIVIILAGVVAMMIRSIFTAAKKPARARAMRTRTKPPRGAFALDDALGKLNETVRILDEKLGDRAPNKHDIEGVRFYIAYLVGIAREVAKMNGVAYGPALETPIRMEMIRLGVIGREAQDLLARILGSDEGQQGLAAGEMDGAEACNPQFRGTYFSRIQTYFTDVQVRGPR